MRNKKIKNVFITAILTFLLAATIVVTIQYMWRVVSAIKYTYPGEIRAAANVLRAAAIEKGINVYDLNNPPEVFVEYASVYSGISLAICGVLARIIHGDIVNVVYSFQVCALFLTGIVAFFAVYRKPHPRQVDSSLKVFGYPIFNSGYIPWEIVVLNMKSSNVVQMSISSGSCVMPLICCNTNINTVLLYDLVSDNPLDICDKEMVNFFESLKEKYAKAGKFLIPKNMKELKEYVDEKLS